MCFNTLLFEQLLPKLIDKGGIIITNDLMWRLMKSEYLVHNKSDDNDCSVEISQCTNMSIFSQPINKYYDYNLFTGIWNSFNEIHGNV